MKRLALILAIAVLGPRWAFSDQITSQGIGPFAGINTQDSPEALNSSQSPDLLNVDISGGGKSIKKRQGYGTDVTLTISTSAVHNLYKFFDSTGNEVRLAFNDNRINSSINGAAWSVVITTGLTSGATWDCTDYLGFAYCVSSAFDCPIKTNGVTSGTTGVCGATGVPQGSLVSNSGDRLLIGAPSGNPSRLYYSQSAVFTNFALGVQPSDSSFEDIVAPGSKLTHIAYRFGRWLWWKDQSFGFIVGTGQFDLQIVVVSNTIGTFDNTDVFDGNYVYFRGSDAQIYTYDGSVLSRAISTDIAPSLQAANRRKANQWTQTSASDFSNGSAFSTHMDTTSLSGSVELFGAQELWASTASWTITGTQFSVTGGSLSYVGATNGGTLLSSSSFNYGNQFYAYFNLQFPAFSSDVLDVGLNNDSTGKQILAEISCPGTGVNAGLLCIRSDSGCLASQSITCTSGAHTMALSAFASGKINLFYDGSLSASVTDSTQGNSFNRSKVKFFQGNSLSNILLGSVYISASTGTYYSAVNNAPNVTSWGTMGITDNIVGNSTITYYTRSSTSSFTVLSSTPSWIAQTKNATVSASTGTFFQLRSDFVTTAATETPTLSDFTFNWFEGSASDKMYGTYFKNAIWFSLSNGTTSTNNRIFRWDLLANVWTLYDIASNGFTTYNNDLYFGDPSVGKIYRFGNNVYSDNGTAITAYWKSKPFFGDSPFTEKDLRTGSWYIASDSGTTLSVTYTLDESTNTVVKNISLSDSRKGMIRNNYNFPAGTAPTVFSTKVGDTSSSAPWEVFGGLVTFVPRPPIVTP